MTSIIRDFDRAGQKCFLCDNLDKNLNKYRRDEETIQKSVKTFKTFKTLPLKFAGFFKVLNILSKKFNLIETGKG